MANVVDVITAADIPGSRTFGIHHPDQPVFAFEEIRYSGEVFAAVAATSPSAARAGAEAVVIDYAEVVKPSTSANTNFKVASAKESGEYYGT